MLSVAGLMLFFGHDTRRLRQVIATEEFGGTIEGIGPGCTFDDVEAAWTHALVDAQVVDGPPATRVLLLPSPDGGVHAFYFAESGGALALRHAAYSEEAWTHEDLQAGDGTTGMGAAIDSKGVLHVAHVGVGTALVHRFNAHGIGRRHEDA